VVGFGAAFDSRKDGRGIARAVRAALAEAGIGAEEVDHVHAHGLSTGPADAWESRGLAEALGPAVPPVFAAKSYLGNLGAAAGTTELAAAALALNHGVLPPTLNYETPDPECPIPVQAGQPRPVERPYLVKLGFTDMGQVGAVVLRRWS
jgi:3-oxoacyl-[acyl-carrier-protein] synthase II